MELIDLEQLDNLIHLLIKHDIPINLILKLLNINSLSELNIAKYNYLLILIKS